MQSIDCSAFRLALGVPFHASVLGTYHEAGVLPLDDYRNLACAKYVIRSASVQNSNHMEINLRSDIHFPKRAQRIRSNETILTYSSKLIEKSGVDHKNLSPRFPVSPIPSWELLPAKFDYNYTTMSKKENINILGSEARTHIYNSYSNHLKVFTDGSLLNNSAGCGFVIPALKTEKSFYLGQNVSIFTAELLAILMALRYLLDVPLNFYSLLFCVDSKSVLQSLESINPKNRIEIITEIKLLIHNLIIRGTTVQFCWIPSHCLIFGNEWADRTARAGARKADGSVVITIPLSLHEGYSLLQRVSNEFFDKTYKDSILTKLHKPGSSAKCCFNLQLKRFAKHDTLLNHAFQNRNVNLHLKCKKRFKSLFYRLKLNAFQTKFVKNVRCICR